MKSLTLVALVIVLALLTALPASAQGGCGCELPGPEPRAPLRAWLPLVAVEGVPFVILYPPPLPPAPPEQGAPSALDKPVRPPPLYLPLVGGGL